MELNPLAWLLMLPPLAYMEYVKIDNDVPMDDDLGTAAGAFLAEPVLLFFLIVFEAMGLCVPQSAPRSKPRSIPHPHLPRPSHARRPYQVPQCGSTTTTPS